MCHSQAPDGTHACLYCGSPFIVKRPPGPRRPTPLLSVRGQSTVDHLTDDPLMSMGLEEEGADTIQMFPDDLIVQEELNENFMVSVRTPIESIPEPKRTIPQRDRPRASSATGLDLPVLTMNDQETRDEDDDGLASLSILNQPSFEPSFHQDSASSSRRAAQLTDLETPPLVDSLQGRSEQREQVNQKSADRHSAVTIALQKPPENTPLRLFIPMLIISAVGGYLIADRSFLYALIGLDSSPPPPTTSSAIDSPPLSASKNDRPLDAPLPAPLSPAPLSPAPSLPTPSLPAPSIAPLSPQRADPLKAESPSSPQFDFTLHSPDPPDPVFADSVSTRKSQIRRGQKKRAKSAPSRRASSPPKRSYKSLMKKGETLLIKGSVTQARRVFKEAGQLKPGAPAPIAQLGWCELAQNRLGSAIRYFQLALKKSSVHGDSLYGLGYAYERQKSWSQARAFFEKYLQRYPSGSKVRIIQNKLKKMPQN
jgi:hypothetical protein